MEKSLPATGRTLKSPANLGFLRFMKFMITAKRVLFVLLTVTGLALYAAGATQQGPCPLPVNETSSSSAADTQSPENPPCRRVVLHNGMPICLPCPAADAHTRVHG